MKKIKKVLISVTALIMACAFGLTACDIGGTVNGGGDNGGNEDGHKHSYSQTVIDPTCTEKGYTEYKCNCGDSYKDNYVDAKGHSEVIDAGVGATCTTDGKTEGKHCSVCNEVIVAQTVIPKGHRINGNNVCEVCGNDVATVGLKYSEYDTYCGVAGIGEATDTEIYIAATYNGKPVTHIIDGSFYNCKTITRLVIPDSVTKIGTSAFLGCSNLVSATIGNSVKTIGDSAFGNCTGLTNVAMGNSVQEIYASAFSSTAITNLTIPDTVKNIGRLAFMGCKNLQYNVYNNANYLGNAYNPYLALISIIEESTSCTVNEDTKIIAGAAFMGGKISSLNIPDSVESLGEYAFYANPFITSVTIGNGVTRIENAVFSSCNNLVSVTLGNSLQSIGDSMFSGCHKLENVTIPETVTSIGSYAFSNCYSITSVVIPDLVMKIGSYAFRGCKRLMSLTVGSSVTSIGSSAFADCTKLVEVYNLSELEITAGANGNGKVGYYAKEIFTDKAATSKLSSTQDGFTFYEFDNKYYLLDYSGTSDKIITPESFNGKSYEIYKYAFYAEERLTDVTLSDGVTAVGERAFYDCDNLLKLSIGNGVTTVGERAFYDCDNLLSVTLGSSVAEIKVDAFGSCIKLIEICNLSELEITADSEDNGYIGYNVKYLCTSASGMGQITVTQDEYIFYENGNHRYLSGYVGDSNILFLPDNFNGGSYEILCNAFNYFKDLKAITISSAVTVIGYGAFNFCINLTEINYKGTKEQWENIVKEANWDLYSAEYVVHCTDGDIAKSEG